jgi:hypothetical protein
MHQRSLAIVFLAAAGMLIGARPVPASAALQTACATIPLAEVRAIVAAPVDVFVPGSSGPTVRMGITMSTCTYTSRTRAATFSLMQAPAARLASTYDFYMKRHQEQPRIKGGVLVLASVRNGAAIDLTASGKLLDAVAKNVR